MSLLKKLEKKGHRIQEDEEEDTEEFAQEKVQAKEERLLQVGDVLGKTLEDLAVEEETQAEPDCETEIQPLDSPGEVVEINVGHTAEKVQDEAISELAWNLIGQAYIDGMRGALAQAGIIKQ